MSVQEEHEAFRNRYVKTLFRRVASRRAAERFVGCARMPVYDMNLVRIYLYYY